MSCWEQPPYSPSHPTKVMSHKPLTLWSHCRHFYTENTFSVIFHIYSTNLIVFLYYSCASLTWPRALCLTPLQYHIMLFAVCPLILSRVALFWIFHKVRWAAFAWMNELGSFSAPCLQGGPSAPSSADCTDGSAHAHLWELQSAAVWPDPQPGIATFQPVSASFGTRARVRWALRATRTPKTREDFCAPRLSCALSLCR